VTLQVGLVLTGIMMMDRLQFFNTSRVKNLCLVLLDLEEAERALKEEHARREQQELKLVRTCKSRRFVQQLLQ
jgi:hypothetical protein